MCTTTASNPVRQPLAEQIVAIFAATVIDDLPIPADLAKFISKEKAEQIAALRHLYRRNIAELVLRKAHEVFDLAKARPDVGSVTASHHVPFLSAKPVPNGTGGGP